MVKTSLTLKKSSAVLQELLKPRTRLRLIYVEAGLSHKWQHAFLRHNIAVIKAISSGGQTGSPLLVITLIAEAEARELMYAQSRTALL